MRLIVCVYVFVCTHVRMCSVLTCVYMCFCAFDCARVSCACACVVCGRRLCHIVTLQLAPRLRDLVCVCVRARVCVCVRMHPALFATLG